MKRFLSIVTGALLFMPTLSAAESAMTDSTKTAKYVGDLSLTVALNGSGASNSIIRPMWSYSQEWGRYTQYEGWEASVYTKVNYHWHNKKDWFSINVGAALEASTDKNLMMLHEAYVSGKIWEIGYSFGREAYTPLPQNDGLGLGTYLLSNNARPITRFGVGFFDYWAIPGIKNWIELKAAFYIGFMPNEDNPDFTKNVLIHDKFFYIRIGRFPIKPYVGLTHSVMMGGTMSDGTQIPIDFWASFIGSGSKKMKEAGFEGEYYNAAGGHQGMWDLGLDFDFEPVSASLYYQRPIYDKTAMNLFAFQYCRDFTLGTTINLKNFKPIKSFNFEYLTTEWQGGKGPADPKFISTGPEAEGAPIYLCQNEVSPDVLKKYLGPQVTEWEQSTGHPLTQEECDPFLKKYTLPEGWDWGNRSPYLENYYYPQGWTAGGLAMGYPLMLTSTTMSKVAPGYDFFMRFSAVRMMAFNVGLSGDIIPGLDYKVKFTYSKNYGTYQEEYYNDIRFAEQRPNYYFSTSKNEFYTGLWLNYRWRIFTFSTAFNYDFGDIYNSFSARLGVSISLDKLLP